MVSNWRMKLQVFATVDFAEKAMVLIVEHGYGVGVGHICSCAAATTGVCQWRRCSWVAATVVAGGRPAQGVLLLMSAGTMI